MQSVKEGDMAEGGKEATEKVGLTVQWVSDDLETMERAAIALSARDHGDYTRTDIIRMGARRFAAEILADTAAV